ncbi:MAG TPA: hypothetical protein VNF75_00360 [Candidatus Dormibacteraeota bacterium]|nr:hypothetical protein [Candidatus Dormibacteraeota bacterium]
MSTIAETSHEISKLYEVDHLTRRERNARRNKILYIDRLLNELEQLNIVEEVVVPTPLRTQCRKLLARESHPLGRGRAEEVAIADWMDALYDVQDGLMFTIGDEDE